MSRVHVALSCVVAFAMTVCADAGAQGSLYPAPAVPGQLQPPTAMTCQAAQTNINHASVADLATGLQVSRPIAQRVVEHRPFLRPAELLAVPGIGPGRWEALEDAGAACATPIGHPPAAPDPCRGAGRIDLNDPASAARLGSLWGRPTAERVIAAQPHYALENVVRVPGVGAGRLKHDADSICITPPPIDVADGTRFGYAYGAPGGKVELKGFRLVTPAGVIDDPVGAWLSVTPQVTPTRDLPGLPWPSADFHVHAAWQDGQEHVYVTLPADPALTEFGSGWEPYIAHWDSGGRTSGEELAGSEIEYLRDAGAVTAAVTSLSWLDSLSRGIAWAFEPLAALLSDARFSPPSCSPAWAADDSTRARWYRDGARVELVGALLDIPGNPAPPFGFLIKHCVAASVDNNPAHATDDASVRLRNNTKAMASLTHVAGDAGLAGPDILGAPALDLLFSQLAGTVLRHPVAYAGADVTATVPPGTFGSVRLQANPVLTTVWVALNESPVGEIAENVGFAVARDVLKVSIDCILRAAGAGRLDGVTDIAGALPGLMQACIDLEAIKVELLRAKSEGRIKPENVGKVGVLLNKLQRWYIWLKVGSISVSGFDTFFSVGTNGGQVVIDHFAAAPQFDQLGNPVNIACLRLRGWRFEVDLDCQARWRAMLSEIPPDCRTGGPQGGANPQCQPATNPGAPPDNSGCWQYDDLAQAWVLDVSTGGQACLLRDQVLCVDGCIPWPAASNKVVELTNGQSWFIDARAGSWHLATTDAYHSCVGRFGLLSNPRRSDGKWGSWQMSPYPASGVRYGC